MSIRRISIPARSVVDAGDTILTASETGETQIKKLSINNTAPVGGGTGSTALFSLHRVANGGVADKTNEIATDVALNAGESKTPFQSMDVVLDFEESIQIVTASTNLVVHGWYLVNTS